MTIRLDDVVEEDVVEEDVVEEDVEEDAVVVSLACDSSARSRDKDVCDPEGDIGVGNGPP